MLQGALCVACLHEHLWSNVVWRANGRVCLRADMKLITTPHVNCMLTSWRRVLFHVRCLVLMSSVFFFFLPATPNEK